MKILKYTIALLMCATLLNCSNDDDHSEDLTGQKGDVVLKFDNAVGDQDFIFGTTYNKSNNESFVLNNLKYIISNVRVTDTDGNTYTYPTELNAFIIDEADGNNAGEILVNLEDIDAADYAEITFGIGIDQSRFILGAEGQGEFLTLAQEEGMMWSWATGYKFVRFDGTFSTSTITDEALNIHMGSVGTTLDNYREVTLTFPNTVRVRDNKSPEIHIVADISKIFDGETSVNFSDGYNQVHTNETTTPIIANNIQSMFMVHHVHND
ncbi:MAG: hypothetical protein HRU50_01670 [Winogradskyella sp.]|uniref:MbnP family protein n=1 Tax=Winogradskyella sp. TaxID=1883156 RepID=UPI0025EDF14C|nr:MbnP family protein [Winogradskyella sp.]NRB58632.1 hypothetical protein [Winogradskyella sp.]